MTDNMKNIKSVLFVCSRNTVRSPMAAGLLQKWAGDKIYVASAGMEEGEAVDPFAVAVMHELNIDIGEHVSRNIADLADKKFDLVITLTADAQYRALLLAQGNGWTVENWVVPDPTSTFGPRDMRLQAYRSVRSVLATKIRQYFGDL